MINIINAIPLAADPGWVYKMLSAMRSGVAGSTQAFASLALCAGCIIVVLRMLRLAYEIMSDEQQAGFGGVRLWTILRPILILVLIQTCGWWIGGLDSVVGGITSTVQSGVPAAADEQLFTKALSKNASSKDELSFYDQINANAAEAQKDAEQETDVMFSAGASSGNMMLGWVAKLTERIRKNKHNNDKNMASEIAAANGGSVDRRALRKVNRNINTIQNRGNLHEDGDGSWFSFDITDRNIIPTICYYLYKYLYIVMQCVADIILLVLAACAPFMLVFALMDPWRNAVWSFIAQYVQVSFWKVVAAMINWATVSARYGGMMFLGTSTYKDAWQVSTGIADAGTVNAAGGVILAAVMSIAGVFCLLRVQDIAAAIIPSPSGSVGTASGGVQTGRSAVEAPVKVTTSAAGKVMGGIRGVSQMRRRKH